MACGNEWLLQTREENLLERTLNDHFGRYLALPMFVTPITHVRLWSGRSSSPIVNSTWGQSYPSSSTARPPPLQAPGRSLRPWKARCRGSWPVEAHWSVLTKLLVAQILPRKWHTGSVASIFLSLSSSLFGWSFSCSRFDSRSSLFAMLRSSLASIWLCEFSLPSWKRSPWFFSESLTLRCIDAVSGSVSHH